jgi:DNA-binding response OmpR family regulator
VLVVEHDAQVRRFMANTLAEEGYRVLQAAGSSAALELHQCWRSNIDAVVVDAEMPGMPGGDLAARIHRQSPLLPVLMVAASGDPSGQNQDCAVLERPFAPEMLLARVADLLASRRSAAASDAVCA